MTTDRMPRILDSLYRAIDDVNAMLPSDQKLQRNEALVLNGQGSSLESITFINFLIAAEESLGAAFGSAPPFTSLLETTDPSRYRTLGDFARFAAEALEKQS